MDSDSLLEKIKRRLYSRKYKQTAEKRRGIGDYSPDLQHVWKSDDSAWDRSGVSTHIEKSFFQKLFYFSLALFFIVLIISGAKYFYNVVLVQQASVITIDVTGKSFVDSGDELSLFVKVQNATDNDIELANILVSYPSGRGEFGQTDLTVPIGNVARRSVVDKKVALQIYGTQGETKNVTITLLYRLVGSNALFEKQDIFPVSIRNAALAINAEAPARRAPGQEVNIPVKVSVLSNDPVQDVALHIQYPYNFVFTEASINPLYGDNIWILGTLQPGEERIIMLSGKIRGAQGGETSLRFLAGQYDQSNEQILDSELDRHVVTIEITDAVLGANIVSDISNNGYIQRNEAASFTLSYRNNSGGRMLNAKIVAHLDGPFDYENINLLSGRFDSNTNTIVWSVDTNPELKTIEQGGGSDIFFSIPTSVNRDTINNELQISLDVEALSDTGEVYNARDVAFITLPIEPEFHLLANTKHHSGPFENSGPVPPRVGKRTSYTITLSAGASFGSLQDVVVHTKLPEWVRWLGNVHPRSSDVSLNETTSDLVWELGDISFSGVGADTQSVSFQVEVVPSTSELGTRVKLTDDITISGIVGDTTKLLKEIKAPTTELTGDISSIGQDGKVVR